MQLENDPSLLVINSQYGFDNSKAQPLEPLLLKVRGQLIEAGYTQNSLYHTDIVMNRLRKKAVELNTSMYTEELRDTFLGDNQYAANDGFCKSRYKMHRLLIHQIESFIANGNVDFSHVKRRYSYIATQKQEFVAAYLLYKKSISHLSKSAERLYCRSVGYFLDYLDFEKGYSSLSDLKKGDISTYIPKVASEHFPNSLRNMFTGLRGFLSLEELNINASFLMEIPQKTKKQHKILQPLSNNEIQQITDLLDEGDNDVSFRDRAIAEVAVSTGYRSVDILGLTFNSFDWDNNILSIVQQKTGRHLEYPLTASIGNAVVTYLLNERPDSESEFIFLHMQAPYLPLASNATSYRILKKIFEKANVSIGTRQIGTRLTRHSRATFLLSKGVPMSLIAQSLGHKNNSTVNVYLTTDEEHMAECVLPLPGKRVDV